MTKRAPNGRYVKEPKMRAAPKLPDIAIITIYLDRAAGDISIDDEFSTPAETSFMLRRGAEIVEDRLDDRHESE